MKTDQREDKTLDILDEIVEASETFGILAIVDVDKRADLGRGERDVLVAHHDLELLTTDSIGRWPHLVVFFHDLGVLNDALELVHHRLVHIGLLANECVVLVVGVVGVAQFAIRSELELEKLVTELAFVPHVVTKVEITRHC